MQQPSFARQSDAAFVAVLIAVLVWLSGDAQAQDEGPFGVGYRKLRGVNYIPRYTIGGTNTPTIPNVQAVESATGMWYYYDIAGSSQADVNKQLQWAKLTGFNAVRVWLSYDYWHYYEYVVPTSPNPHITKFAHFLTLCAANGLRVMPVLFNTFGADPDLSQPANNLNRWYASPGDIEIDRIFSNGQTQTQAHFDASRAGAYVNAFVSLTDDYPDAIFMWDAMNEPSWILKHRDWSLFTLHRIRAVAPGVETTVGTRHISKSPATPYSFDIANSNDCSVLSFHCYGHTRDNIESWYHDAIFADNLTQVFGKPVICTEIGYPGDGQSYLDVVNYVANVEALGDPRVTPGVGYMMFQLMVTTLNFGTKTGLFYPDGTGGANPTGLVRNKPAVIAFINHALAQDPTLSVWNSNALVEQNSSSIYYMNDRPCINIYGNLDYSTIYTDWSEYSVFSFYFGMARWVSALQNVWSFCDFDISNSTNTATICANTFSPTGPNPFAGGNHPSLINILKSLNRFRYWSDISGIVTPHNLYAGRPLGHEDPALVIPGKTQSLIVPQRQSTPGIAITLNQLYLMAQYPWNPITFSQRSVPRPVTVNGITNEWDRMLDLIEAQWIPDPLAPNPSVSCGPDPINNPQGCPAGLTNVVGQVDWLEPDVPGPFQGVYVSMVMQGFVQEYAEVIKYYMTQTVNGRPTRGGPY